MITITDLIHTWPTQSHPTLNIKALHIDKGERVFLHGPSGCGKSTLLGLLAGINALQSGQIKILNTDLSTIKNTHKDRFRADHIGTIFQSFNLLPYLNPLENVTLGCEFSKQRRKRLTDKKTDMTTEAIRLLKALGLNDSQLTQHVSKLSIGQQQRVAAARAFIGEPELIIADEPTSSLDEDSRHAFIETLFNQAGDYQASVLFVSHDKSLASLFDRQISLLDINGV
ncbi:ABC transporter ATP-binding protein [Pseudoalteromonas aurantia]|uniref:Methionine ABC transporter ATP-binding protein n=1 Tax=Pseudoalteromonas aurantia TaxID=43654 RepID=A0A5S3V974_9GAMM|nr:ABC transporter ATP-binding protein [Pseudoalteromonas aurantia]TMO61740.1 methionine ABC transporter ATP-binding protein [Pseudoalteromonas aurantia]TMO68439.1 methionine ABC transporter ATP-binding protein [Pseudoalteromonas aurantia]TMO78548.1 methionine ABC transporter ATP-binding protein [Pseudoalteromonas aurantia]